MKTIITSIIVALIACSSVPADEPNRTDMEFKAERAIYSLLIRKHSPGDIQCWAGKVKKNGRVSDEVLLNMLIAYTKQGKLPPYSESAPYPLTSPFDAQRIASRGLELYPGNPRLEAAALDVFRRDDIANPGRYSGLDLAAHQGSDELIQEFRKSVADPRFLESFDRQVERRSQPRFARNRFPEGIRFENWVAQRTRIPFQQQATTLLTICLIAVMALGFAFAKKWPRAKRIGAMSFAAGIVLAVLWIGVRGIRWSSQDDEITDHSAKFDADSPAKHLH